MMNTRNLVWISGLSVEYHNLYDVEFSHFDDDKFGIDDETILKRMLLRNS